MGSRGSTRVPILACQAVCWVTFLSPLLKNFRKFCLFVLIILHSLDILWVSQVSYSQVPSQVPSQISSQVLSKVPSQVLRCLDLGGRLLVQVTFLAVPWARQVPCRMCPGTFSEKRTKRENSHVSSLPLYTLQMKTSGQIFNRDKGCNLKKSPGIVKRPAKLSLHRSMWLRVCLDGGLCPSEVSHSVCVWRGEGMPQNHKELLQSLLWQHEPAMPRQYGARQ